MTIAQLLVWAGVATLALWGLIASEFLCRYFAARLDYYVYIPRERWRVFPVPSLSSRVPKFAEVLCNSRGERGGDVSGNEDLSVLICGGSTGECLVLGNSQSIGGVIELSAAQMGVSARAGSICRSGLNLKGTLRALECIKHRYHQLDAVVIISGASDVLRWLAQGCDSGGLEAPDDKTIFRVCPSTGFSWSPSKTAAAFYVRLFRDSIWRRWRLFPRLGNRQVAARAMLHRLPSTGMEGVQGLDCLLDSVRLNTEEIITTAKAMAKQVLLIPQSGVDPVQYPECEAILWQGTVESGPLSGRRFSYEVIDNLMSSVATVMSKVAQQQGIASIELRTVLQRGPEHFYDDFHLTPEGAQVLGACIANALIRPVDPLKH